MEESQKREVPRLSESGASEELLAVVAKTLGESVETLMALSHKELMAKLQLFKGFSNKGLVRGPGERKLGKYEHNPAGSKLARIVAERRLGIACRGH